METAKLEAVEPVPFSYPNDFLVSLYPQTKPKTSEFSRLPHRALGDFGEMRAKCLFEQSGYSVKRTLCGSKCGDLRVCKNGQGYRSSRIEVKTAQCGKNNKYRFCLSKGKHTNHCHSDYVLLIAIDKYDTEYLYLIPSFAIAEITYISLSNQVTYSGQFAKYRIHGQISLTASLEVGLL